MKKLHRNVAFFATRFASFKESRELFEIDFLN